MELDRIIKKIIGAAMKVHSSLDPGLLESTYQACLFRELEKQGCTVLKEQENRTVDNFNVTHLRDGITRRVNQPLCSSVPSVVKGLEL